MRVGSELSMSPCRIISLIYMQVGGFTAIHENIIMMQEVSTISLHPIAHVGMENNTTGNVKICKYCDLRGLHLWDTDSGLLVTYKSRQYG